MADISKLEQQANLLMNTAIEQRSDAYGGLPAQKC